MIALAKYKSSAIELGKKFIKSIGLGGSVMTTKECYPFGFDSQPQENWTAVYAETSNRDEAVIIGYINKNQLTQAGESRMYAVGSNGEVGAFLWCKQEGVLGLNGFDHTAVRFGPLATAVEAQNALINAEFAKIAVAIGLLGGSYTSGTITTDLTSANSETVKLK